MYLKKLEMLGFKSFADKTELLFESGMTCIVGPNGCGKSNVVDAFKWIFGEQSAKGLRGSEMKDVIFNGTLERKPTGFAEVTVVFENSDRFLDIDYSEVAITRRLYRSGESEYLINKQRCRLKDIRELFMGTGIGQTSYSILEQGKIDVLLQANNVERRHVFEEAAGISKYLSKKAETLRALIRIEENLVRLNDIVAEVDKRLQRVKAQASKARRYRELSERLKDLRVRSALDDYRESVAARAEISFRLHWSQFRIDLIEGLIFELQSAADRRGAERTEHEAAVTLVRERLASERLLAERARERMEQERRRSLELVAEKSRKLDELDSTTAALRQLFERLDQEKREVASLVTDIEAKKGRFQTLHAEFDGVHRQRARIEEARESGKNKVVALLQARSRVLNEWTQVEAELSNLRGQGERLVAAIDAHSAQVAREQSLEKEKRAEENLLKLESERLSRARAQCESSTESLSAELETLDEELAAKVGLLVERRSRYEVLKSLEEKLEGVGRGVQDILRRRESLPELADLRGLHGMVGSLVKVESRYARAVEAALGAQAESLVLESQDGALSLLDFARKDGSGRVEVISLDRVDSIAPEYFSRQAGVLGPLVDRVQVAEDHEELFRRLLANVVLVEDFDTAVALSRNGLRPFRLVTIGGEVIEPWGGLSIAGKSDLGIISRRSEMDDLQRVVNLLEGEEALLRKRQSELKRGVLDGRTELDRLREELQRVSRSVVQSEGVLSQITREKERLGREISVGSSELKEIELETASRKESLLALTAKLEALDQERTAAEEECRGLDRSVREASEMESVAQEDCTQARLDLAQAEKRLEGLREMVKRDELSLEDRQQTIASLGAEVRLIEERHREAEDAFRSSEQELTEVATREDLVRRELEVAEATGAALRDQEQLLRKEVDNAHQEQARVQKERESAQLRDQEERHRRNSILERMDEEYGLDLVRLMESHEINAADSNSVPTLPDELQPLAKYFTPDPAWDREKVREEVREIQEKLRRLGSVNLEALDELGELEERQKFQLAQRADLTESAKSLQEIIAEINRTSRDLFLKTFVEVQTHFSDLFRKCFGGGKAELVLEEGQDVLEAGIDIVAKPPGKKITTLSLMSGGEKTMTTIALLFAIFRARPSPFCILDEVDAPLDETNVRRFSVLLKDFLAQTQFVVVSHNKVTMAEANTLYGVTMQEHGVSKRVSVELESYDPEKMEAALA